MTAQTRSQEAHGASEVTSDVPVFKVDRYFMSIPIFFTCLLHIHILHTYLYLLLLPDDPFFFKSLALLQRQTISGLQ
jgi:hypothetical protein